MGVWDWHVHSAVFETDKQKGDTAKKKKVEFSFLSQENSQLCKCP